MADGQLAFGLTDTDDACGAVDRGSPVVIIVPDQKPGEMGTLVIPNTVAMIAGAPAHSRGKKLHRLRTGPENRGLAGLLRVDPDPEP